MPEDRSNERVQEIRGRNHRLHHVITGRDFYRLLTAFLASKRLIKLSDGQDFCPYWQMRNEFKELEIARLLLHTAITVRTMLDDDAALEKYHGFDLPEPPPVGMLIKNVRKPDDEEPLSLREACNKIIHAELINFDRSNSTSPTKSYLNPKVYLYSSRDRSSGWKAVLDIEAYAGAGLRSVDF